MLHTDLATFQAQARHRDLRAEADRARRLTLAQPARLSLAAALRHAAAGLGGRRVPPSLPTTAPAAT